MLNFQYTSSVFKPTESAVICNAGSFHSFYANWQTFMQILRRGLCSTKTLKQLKILKLFKFEHLHFPYYDQHLILRFHFLVLPQFPLHWVGHHYHHHLIKCFSPLRLLNECDDRFQIEMLII